METGDVDQTGESMADQRNSSRQNPLVSIITVVFNGVNNIEATLLSVINQSYKNKEYIIVDGGSTDGTGATARFDHPYNICLDNSGNIIVADSWNFKIRKVYIGRQNSC